MIDEKGISCTYSRDDRLYEESCMFVSVCVCVFFFSLLSLKLAYMMVYFKSVFFFVGGWGGVGGIISV